MIHLAARGVRLVLLDIEGTTTPIAFVHDILFPYARARLLDWFNTHIHDSEHEAVIRALVAEHAVDRSATADVPAWRDDRTPTATELAAYAAWLTDLDRKSTGLKDVQGFIWDDGYERSELHGVVFPDVASALRRWRDNDVRVAVYSSGSERAQRRLFASLPEGDLTPLFDAFFDTRVGAKRHSGSYLRIAEALGYESGRVLFVSDVAAELDAAVQAGCQVALCLRPGNLPQSRSSYDTITTFDEIV